VIGLALCAFAAQRAAAQTLPHVRTPRVAIPANGAIVIESPDGTEPLLEVYAASGALVEGSQRRVGALSDLGGVYAWVPHEPFLPGAHLVYQTHRQHAQLQRTDMLTVIEPHDGTPPRVTSEPSASTMLVPGAQACCMTPAAERIERCVFVSSLASVQVTAGLSSMDPASKLNQFLFRFEPASSSASSTASSFGPSDFEPFENAGPLTFDQEVDEFCFVLRALNVVTLEEHVYSDVPSCVARGDLPVGEVPAEPPTTFYDLRRCLVPPEGFEPQWCTANAWACEMGMKEDCELHQHVCDNGPLPGRWKLQSLGLAPQEREESCAVAVVGAAPRRRGWAVWLGLGLVVLAGRRRLAYT